MKIKLLIFGLALLIIPVVSAVSIKATDACYSYDYGRAPGSPCKNIGAENYDAWLRTCATVSGCTASWWNFNCYNAPEDPWYYMPCDASNQGQTYHCACGNTYTCPYVAPTCSNFTVSNSQPTKGDTIQLSALATADSGISQVQFYYGKQLAAQCNLKPLYNWTLIGNGVYNNTTGKWEINFNTGALNAGDYVVSTNVFDNRSPKKSCSANPTCNGNLGCCPSFDAACPDCSQPIEVLPTCVDPTAVNLNSSCNIVTAKYTANANHINAADKVEIQDNVSGPKFELVPLTGFGSVIGARTATYDIGTSTPGRNPSDPAVSHPVTWTHTWNTKENGKLSKLCTKVTSFGSDQYNIPSCGSADAVSQTGLTNPVSLSPSNFTVSVFDSPQSPGVGGFVYKYMGDSSMPNANYLHCTRNGASFPVVTSGTAITGKYDCNVVKVSNGDSFNWIHTYNRQVQNCPNLVSPTCSKTFASGIDVVRPAGMLLTGTGDVYIRGAVEQSGFQSSGAISFSAQTLSSAKNINALKLSTSGICSSVPLVCSAKQNLLLNYDDSNTSAAPTTWFGIIKKIIDQDKVRTRKDFSASANFTYNPADGAAYQILNYNGNLTISAGAKCLNKNLFIVNGNLTINPDFTIADKTQNACLFIVDGTVNIAGGNAAVTDKVEAFIIAKNVVIPRDGRDGLLIKGGLITTDAGAGLDNIFQRNINGDTPAELVPNQSSELINYEGARYIYFFKDILKDSAKLGIREPNYQQ